MTRRRLGPKRKVGLEPVDKAELDWSNADYCREDCGSLLYMPFFLRNCDLPSKLVRHPTLHVVKLHHLAPVSTMASGFPPPAVHEIASQVSALLKERSESVCVAETVRSASPESFLALSRHTTNG